MKKLSLIVTVFLFNCLIFGETASVSKKVYPDRDTIIELDGVTLNVPSGSVSKELTIKISKLDNTHYMNSSMENVTIGAASYRFEPAGTKFNNEIEVVIPFDKKLLESETALSNLFTYFYDKETTRWERLPRKNIDREECRVVSLTDHFTDMITATLKMPETPEPLDFNINSIKNLEVMNPAAGVGKLDGLKPGNTGSASFQIPLNIPNGRGGATPQVAISYNSDSPNSWMGKGFDLSVPAISTDTSFGLPKYNSEDVYMYEGEKLVPVTVGVDKTIYRPRVERSFKQIVKITEGGIAFWEVTDKAGTVEVYGKSNGWIGPDRTNRTKVFIWYLTKKIDINGNSVTYNYDFDSINNHVYLSEIVYSNYENGANVTPGRYKIKFNSADGRADIRQNARGKFLSSLSRLLNSVDVQHKGSGSLTYDTVRSYKFTYVPNVFGWSMLKTITETDVAGNVFYEHGFDYEELTAKLDGVGNIIGYEGFGDTPVDWNATSGNNFPDLDTTQTVGVGASLFIGVHLDILTWRKWGFKWKPILGLGISGGVDYSGTINTSLLMDVDGDGLPDSVWKDLFNNSGLRYYKNTGNGFDTSIAHSIPGVHGLLNDSRQTGWNFGLSATVGPASGSVSWKESSTEGKSTFTDINADGFVDFVKSGSGNYYKNSMYGNSDSDPYYRRTSHGFNSKSFVTGNDVAAIPADIDMDMYERTYFNQEPLRKWKAFTGGHIKVSQRVKLKNPSKISSDGVSADTYPHGTNSVKKMALTSSITEGTLETSYSINSGEEIFFHMDTGKDPRGDDLDWDISIRYDSINYFESIKYAGTPKPRDLYIDSVPDPALGDLYTSRAVQETENGVARQRIYYELKSNYKSLITPSLMDYLVTKGLFSPNRIPENLFFKIFAWATDERVIPVSPDNPEERLELGEKSYLIDSYTYRPEFRDFIKTASYSDSFIDTLLARLTQEERDSLFYFKDFNNRFHIVSDSNSFEDRAATLTVPSELLVSLEGATLGSKDIYDNILIDRIYSEDGFRVTEFLKLELSTSGNYKLIRSKLDGIGNVVSNEIVNASITDTGSELKIVYIIDGVEHLYNLSVPVDQLEKLPKVVYEDEAVLNSLTSTYTFIGNYPTYDILTPIEYEDLTADANTRLTLADKDFIKRVYSPYPTVLTPDTYKLDPQLTADDKVRLILIIDKLSYDPDTILDKPYKASSPSNFGIIALTKEEYDTYLSRYSGVETLFTPIEDSAQNVYYVLKENLNSSEKSSLEVIYRRYLMDSVEFPYFDYSEAEQSYILKTTLTDAELQEVQTVFNFKIYTKLNRSLKFHASSLFKVTESSVNPTGTVDNLMARGSAALDYSNAGYVRVPLFNNGKKAYVKRYVYSYNSGRDYSPENIVVDYPEVVYGGGVEGEESPHVRGTKFAEKISDPDNVTDIDKEFELLSGGVAGWYRGVWGGYYNFDRDLIYKIPPQNTGQYDPNSATNEVSLPNYIRSFTKNLNSDGTITLDKTGKDPEYNYLNTSTLIGDISSYSDLDFDATGKPVTNEYKFAVSLEGNILHAVRSGGDIYFNVPKGNSPLSGGRIGLVSGSKSKSTDYNGSFSIAGFGSNFSRDKGSSWQYQSLMDINGDRYPDIVSFNSSKSGSGSFSATLGNGEGFGETVIYTIPSGYLSKSDNLTYGFGSAPTGGPSLSLEYKNGKVLSVNVRQPSNDVVVGFPGVNGSLGSSIQTQAFMDINGDGLPDHLRRYGTGSYTAYLNTGNNNFSSAVGYGSGITSGSFPSVGDISLTPKGISYSNSGSYGSGLSINLGPVSGSTGFSGTANRTTSQLMDFNGDGLLDQVVKVHGDSYFRVKFNLGTSFSNEVKIYRPEWDSSFNSRGSELQNLINQCTNGLNDLGLPMVDSVSAVTSFPDIGGSKFSGMLNPLALEDTLNYTSGVSINLGASVNIPLIQFYFVIFRLGLTLTPGVNGTYATNTTTVSMGDINGDGLPDHILRNTGSNKITVKINDMGRIGLLKTIRTPQGGTINLDYTRTGNTVNMPQSQYVLSEVTINDGFENDVAKAGVHSYTDKFEYKNGYHDRKERTFYGFSEVKVTKADGSVVTTNYDNRSYYTKGLVLSSSVADLSGKEYKATENYYSEDSTILGFPMVQHHFLQTTKEKTFDPTDNDVLETSVSYAYDNYGNVTRMEQHGLANDVTDNLVLEIDYDNSFTSTYIKALPKVMRVYDYRSNLLRKREGYYDNKGNLIELDNYYESNKISKHNFEYDSYGNITKVVDPLGFTKEYEYDTLVNSYVTTISTYNRSQPNNKYVSYLTYDFRYGVEKTQTDLNGFVMSKEYDNFGRLLSISTPYDTGIVKAVEYEYDTSTFPWKALTKNKVSFDPLDNETMDTYVYIDGLGRSITTAKGGVVRRGTTDFTGWSKSGFITYDAKGRTIESGQTEFEETLIAPIPSNTPIRPTLTTYDILDRALTVTFPDNSIVTNSYMVIGDNHVAAVTDPMGNVTRTYTDIRGNITKIVKLGSNGLELTRVDYEYNPLGELLKVTDANNSVTSFQYDMIGRQIRLESPETGVTEFEYNKAGQLVRKVDANLRNKGASINYIYDSFGRLETVDYPYLTDTVYTYGAPNDLNNGAGRVIKITDDSGSTENFYGKMGEVTKLIKTINRLTPNTTAKSAEFNFVYDYQGRMEEITYPDGEVLTYTYNAGGAVNKVSSVIGLGGSTVETTYVEDIGYDEFGQRTYVRYGNRLNGTPIETTYTYDENRRWLTGLVTKRGMGTLQNITYQFDKMGNISNLVNDSDKYHLTQNYSYDELYQLTEGKGLFLDKQYSSAGDDNEYTQNFSYDKVGNLLQKNSSNFIRTGSNGTNLNYSHTYTYNVDKPKQAKTIGNLWFLYDANGNTIEERVGGHSPDGLNRIGDLAHEGGVNIVNRGIGLVRSSEINTDVYARTFEWDEENRLRSSVDPVNTVHYRYDSTGTRTNKFSSKETLYFSKMWLLTEDGTKFRESKNIYLGASRVATRLGFEDTSSVEYSRLNTYYYHADHLGSSNIVTDYEGVVFEHLEYTPFGETWINKTTDIQKLLPYKFTGQELDQETGLYYHGARYYNPKISRWMSSDPAGFGLINPKSNAFSAIQSNNWYSYVSNNPVKYTDPTGLFYVRDGNMSGPTTYGDKLPDLVKHYNEKTGFNFTVEEIAKYNNISESGFLRPGTEIKFPVDLWRADEILLMAGSGFDVLGTGTCLRYGMATVIFSNTRGDSFTAEFPVKITDEFGLYGEILGVNLSSATYYMNLRINASEQEVIESFEGDFDSIGCTVQLGWLSASLNWTEGVDSTGKDIKDARTWRALGGGFGASAGSKGVNFYSRSRYGKGKKIDGR